MLLYYVRHGDPIYDPNQLTELGKLQAAAVAKRLARYGVDEVYTSPSNRARQTAQPLCDLVKQDAVILDWADEENPWQDLVIKHPDGRRTWAFRNPETILLFNSEEVRNLGRLWYTHPAFANTEFGAGICRIQKQADAFLESLGYRHDHARNCYYEVTPNDKRLALFAHEGIGAAFLSCVLDIPYPMFSTRFAMTPTGVTVLRFEPQNGIVIPQILTYSNDAHIYGEGLPTKWGNQVFI